MNRTRHVTIGGDRGRRPSEIARVLWAMALGLLAAATASARPTIELSVDDSEAMVGERVTVTVAVTGWEEGMTVELDDGQGYQRRLLHSTRSSFRRTRIVNGRIVVDEGGDTQNTHFAVTPTAPGALQIGPVRVSSASGEMLARSEGLRLVAKEPAKRPDVVVRAALSDAEAYAGQIVELRVDILRAPNTHFETIELFAGSVEEPFEPRGAEPDAARNAFGFLGKNVAVEVGQEDVGGVAFDRFTLRRQLIAERVGEFELDPVILVADFAAEGFRRTSKIGVPSEPMSVRVRPLPTVGMPRGFSGLVGDVNADASASAESAEVGEPITLLLTVSGDAALERLGQPDLSDQTGWTDALRVRASDRQPILSGETITFEYTVRVIDPQLREIPPASVGYFDPDAGEYLTAESAPIPIEITGGSLASLDQATVGSARAAGEGDPEAGGGGDAGSTARSAASAGASADRSRASLVDARADLSANEVGAALLADDSFDVGRAMSNPLVAASIAAPPVAYAAAFVGLVAARRWRERRAASSPRSAAAAALRALDSQSAQASEPGAAVAAALVGYAARRRGAADAREAGARALTPSEAAALLSEDAPHVSKMAWALARQAEASRYAGGGVSHSELEGARRLFTEVAANGGNASVPAEEYDADPGEPRGEAP